MFNEDIDLRAEKVGEFVAATGATVRAAANEFGISKSTVHKDLTERLKNISPELYEKVKKILAVNRAERHIRGGRATRQKYKEKESKGENTGLAE